MQECVLDVRMLLKEKESKKLFTDSIVFNFDFLDYFKYEDLGNLTYMTKVIQDYIKHHYKYDIVSITHLTCKFYNNTKTSP